MKIITYILYLSICGCATTHEWTGSNTIAEISYQVLNAVDANQTSRISSSNHLVEGWPVTKTVLGKKPDPTETYIYFGTLGLSHYLIGRLLPKSFRAFWQAGAIGISGAAVANNCDIMKCIN